MQAEMTNAHKAIGQNVREKTADKLHGGQGHQLLFAMIAVIEILEGDSIFANGNDTMIGNGNAEDVASEIFEQFLHAVDGSLDIDFPIFGEGLRQHNLDVECAILGIEFAICPKMSESEAKAVAELIGKQFDGKEESMGSGLPAKASRGEDQRAAGDDEMQMEMLLHGLPPGMQDHRKTDLTAEILASKLFQQLSGDFNEEIEK